MLSASEAKNRACAHNVYALHINQIEAAIIEAVSENLLHCDWYTKAGYNCSEEDLAEIKYIVELLEFLGYKVTKNIFLPNDVFPNTRVKLHINWESSQNNNSKEKEKEKKD